MCSFVSLGILSVMYVPFCVFCLIVLFCVLFVCKCVLPQSDNPVAVNKYINKRGVAECEIVIAQFNCILVVTRWQNTFTHKQYREQHKQQPNNTNNNQTTQITTNVESAGRAQSLRVLP